jgi:endonuclease/exonuclease/phosphatase (EEP) superfamily protein YafD
VRWVLDNTLNFAPHLATLLLLVAAWALVERIWPLVALSLLVAVAAAVWTIRCERLLRRPRARGASRNHHPSRATPRTRAPGAEANLRVATFNAHGAAADFNALAAYLERAAVDVLVLQEFDDEAVARAEPLLEAYPHRLTTQPRWRATHPRWLEVLSRVPLADAAGRPTDRQPPSRAVVRVSLEEPFHLTLHVLHAMDPVSPARFASRRQQFGLLANAVAGHPGPAIAAGDLNATVRSPALAALLRDTGLRSAVAGRGDPPTWPRWLGPFGLHLDHLLLRDLILCDAERGPAFGSDHHLMLVEVAPSTTG